MNNPALFAVEAYKLIENGDFQQALSLCDEGLAKYIDYPTGYLITVKAALEAEGLDRANEYIDRAMQFLDKNYVEEYLKKEVEKYTERQFTAENNSSGGGVFIAPNGDGIENLMAKMSNDTPLVEDNFFQEETPDTNAIDDFSDIAETEVEVSNTDDIVSNENIPNAEEATISNEVAKEVLPEEAPSEKELLKEDINEKNLTEQNPDLFVDNGIRIDDEFPHLEIESGVAVGESDNLHNMSVTEVNLPASELNLPSAEISINNFAFAVNTPSVVLETSLVEDITPEEVKLPEEMAIDESIAIPENIHLPEDLEIPVESTTPSEEPIEGYNVGIANEGNNYEIAPGFESDDIDSIQIDEVVDNPEIDEISATEDVDEGKEDEASLYDDNNETKFGDYRKFASAMQDAFESTIYTQPETVVPDIEFTAKFDGNNPDNNDISDEELVIQEVETNYSDEEYNYYTDYSEKYQGIRGFALKLMGKKNKGRKFQSERLNSLPGLNNTPSNICGASCDIEQSYRPIPPAPEYNIDDIPAMGLKNFSFVMDNSNEITDNTVGNEMEDYSASKDSSVAIVSDTMANILAMQGAYGEAIEMLEKLKSINPAKIDTYQNKIDELKQKI